MDWHPLTSSNVRAIAYNAEEQWLYVAFKRGGSTYRYFEVPDSLFQEFLKAESKGRFLDRKIKKGCYRYEKL